MSILAEKVLCHNCPARRTINLIGIPDYVLDDLTVNHDAKRVFWKGLDLIATVGEYRIISFLSKEVGQHQSYRSIYDALHYVGFVAGPGNHGYMGNVRSAIKRCRNKFKTVDPNFNRIENYPGFGYVWRKMP